LCVFAMSYTRTRERERERERTRTRARERVQRGDVEANVPSPCSCCVLSL